MLIDTSYSSLSPSIRAGYSILAATWSDGTIPSLPMAVTAYPLVALAHILKPVPPMRIVQRSPAVRWEAVWANLHGVRLDGSVVSDWYLAIHDVVPRVSALRISAWCQITAVWCVVRRCNIV
jgi:hypothetical protein